MNQSLSSSFKDQIRNLIQLQEIDSKIVALEKEAAQIPLQNEEAQKGYLAFKKIYDKKQGEIDEINKSFKQVDAALQLNQDRIERTKKKIEGVQNTREYAAATKEIEQVEKLNEELNLKKKTATDSLEAAQKELSTLQVDMDVHQKKLDDGSQAGKGQLDKIQSDLLRLNADRQPFVAQVDRQILARYDRIRKGKAGLGIVPVVNGRCQGCNMNILPQLLNQCITCREMVSCTSCHRIVYHPEAVQKSGA